MSSAATFIRVRTYVPQIKMYMYGTRQKNLSELAQSTVAAVHIYSRVNIAYAHACRSSGLCTKNEEQPKLGVQYSNSRGMGLLKCWVVVRIACLPWPVQQ